MKKKLFQTDINFKSENVFDFIVLSADFFFIYSCRHEEKNNNNKTKNKIMRIQKRVEKRYEIEAHN